MILHVLLVVCTRVHVVVESSRSLAGELLLLPRISMNLCRGSYLPVGAYLYIPYAYRDRACVHVRIHVRRSPTSTCMKQ